jgi:hypothetical protein
VTSNDELAQKMSVIFETLDRRQVVLSITWSSAQIKGLLEVLDKATGDTMPPSPQTLSPSISRV